MKSARAIRIYAVLKIRLDTLTAFFSKLPNLDRNPNPFGWNFYSEIFMY